MIRIGVVGYLSKTGIGVMVDDFAEKLGAVAQLVIPHDTAEDLKPSTDRKLVYSNTWSPPPDVVETFSKLVDVVITVESDWGGYLFPRLRKNGVKIALLPMYEWWKPDHNMNAFVDLFFCTTKQGYDGIPFKNKAFIPCPIDTEKIKYKQRTGKPHLFIHNAGNLGIGGRKGTLETVRAFRLSKNPFIRLRVTSQIPLPPAILSAGGYDERITFRIKNFDNYEDLYVDGDVLIYTPHYDGQALVSAEAMAAGLPVITIDAPPMNEHWEIYRWMLTDENYSSARILVDVENTVNAQTINPASLCYYVNEGDLGSTIDWLSEQDMDEISRKNREIAVRAFSWDVCLPQYRNWLELLCDDKVSVSEAVTG